MIVKPIVCDLHNSFVPIKPFSVALCLVDGVILLDHSYEDRNASSQDEKKRLYYLAVKPPSNWNKWTQIMPTKCLPQTKRVTVFSCLYVGRLIVMRTHASLSSLASKPVIRWKPGTAILLCLVYSFRKKR